MGLLSSNSILTIAATGADDSNEGYFVPRNVSVIEPVILKYPIESAFEVGRIFLTPRQATFDESVSRKASESPRLGITRTDLSRRIIHYAREQVYWKRQSVSKAEDGATFKPHSRFNQLLSFHDPPGFSFTQPLQNPWCTLVEGYKSRLLTKDTGHASRSFRDSQRVRETYTAKASGWVYGTLSFASGLVWFARDSSLKQPSTYRAPSWSWGSTEWSSISYNLINRKIVSAIDKRGITMNH